MSKKKKKKKIPQKRQSSHIVEVPAVVEKSENKKPKKIISIKEAKLLRNMADGMTKRQAGIEAGYTGSPETVSVTVSKVLKKANVQDALVDVMNKRGITVEKIVDVVGDGMDAEKMVVTGYGDNTIVDWIPDHGIRLRAASVATDLLGLKKADTTNVIIFNKDKQSSEFFDAD